MQANFQTTRWSLVQQAGDSPSPLQREALARLLEDNWFPLFAYARKTGKSPQEAEDLIQGFIAKLLEKQMLTGIDVQHCGRFRNFLLVCLRNFIKDQWKKGAAVKRGGGDQAVSIDTGEADRRIEPFHELTPEKAFDKAWAVELVTRSLQRVEQAWQDDGKGEVFEVLKPHLLRDGQTPAYEETAATLNVSASTLKVKVHRLRGEFRRALCAEVAETLETEEFLEDELNRLFSAISL